MPTNPYLFNEFTLHHTSGLVGPIDAAVSGGYLFVSDSLTNTVGKYDATTGLPVAGWTSPADLNGPFGLAVSGNTLYVANWSSSVVSAYDVTSGSPISTWTPPPADGLYNPSGLAIGGNTLYVSATGSDSIRAYDTITGAVVSGFSPITGFANCYDVEISGGFLYVTITDRVLKYDATTGEPISVFDWPIAFDAPQGLAALGDDLFAAYYNTSAIRKHDRITGIDTNWFVLEGVSHPTGLEIQIVPEPCSAALLGIRSMTFISLQIKRVGVA